MTISFDLSKDQYSERFKAYNELQRREHLLLRRELKKARVIARIMTIALIILVVAIDLVRYFYF